MRAMSDKIKVRATAVLVEDGQMLLVEQRVSEARPWSLPGGTLEVGETLEACLVREVEEETGLIVGVERLLYLCERIEDDLHVVHITFEVKRLGGCLEVGAEPELGANLIRSVRMVPVGLLGEYGFGQRFCDLAEAGFPGSGSYRGSVASIGL
jgi:ADP-ribose pyrophosphatase YjhB (NUDIX family)